MGCGAPVGGAGRVPGTPFPSSPRAALALGCSLVRAFIVNLKQTKHFREFWSCSGKSLRQRRRDDDPRRTAAQPEVRVPGLALVCEKWEQSLGSALALWGWF